MNCVAALCVDRDSIYHTLPDVECYDIGRDVRTFRGGMPIVAHPPCRSWSAFCAHQAKPVPGEREIGLLCAYWLRKCGGVLEHPAHSRLFAAADLPRPGEDRPGLWTANVLQHWWHHAGTQKSTWLAFSGILRTQVRFPLQLRGQGGDKLLWQMMPRKLRSATCPELAAWLVAAARLAWKEERVE